MSLLHDKLHVTAIEPMAAGEDISSPLAEEAEEKNGGQEMRSRISNKSPAKGLPAKHRVRHRKQRQGQTIFKGHPSWKMVINIKLGVSYTVGRQEDTVYTHKYAMHRTLNCPLHWHAASALLRSTRALQSRPLKLKDFSTVYRQIFPPDGAPSSCGNFGLSQSCTGRGFHGRRSMCSLCVVQVRRSRRATHPRSLSSMITRPSPSATCGSTSG